ncbi:exodeoxyribonuclease V subunit alpha [Thiohalocapsa halophila]|uniref:RecBCD enzyme subunit RecD n=1 Tax=Thiohalocapsa halophila TaxID=69359 RepID=A0ABS1CLZ7_9GAMM|nr:exodeoxyribonuclease V subunit alpha [Thiohalocapsa halophila]MBK1632942.1 exodeoxyribonuclease V subunit alpha [Thiohalocapsa halophila]
MSPSLHALMEAGRLPPLAYYFADFVARGCGQAPDGVFALSAALVSARNLEGDVCIDLAAHAGRVLFADDSAADGGDNADGPVAPALSDWLAALRDCPWVGAPGEQAPLILDCGGPSAADGGSADAPAGSSCRLYLGKYWHFEAAVAAALLGRMQPAADLDPERLADGLARLFPAAVSAGAPAEPDWQRIAAAIAVTRRFAVISGGPGTGKTTTVVKVLALLLEQAPDLRIALAAPTGKAAARLTESIGGGKRRIAADGGTAESVLSRIPEQARTIHRLLGFGRRGAGEDLFQHDADDPLSVDCLVVDEASMIDLPLMARLLAALPASARLVLLGDRDQLASVEAGNVLGDITGRGQPVRYGPAQRALLARVGAAPAALPAAAASSDDDGAPAASTPTPAAAVALLRRSWRFGADSGIGALARAVNAGDGATALALLDDDAHADVTRLVPPADDLHPACIDWAVARFAPVLDAEGPEAALAVLERARVLAALHRGPYGVEALNARIAERLFAEYRAARGAAPSAGDRDGLHHGMPVMITANDYEVGLYNGDVGVLWAEAAGLREPQAPSADPVLRGSGIPAPDAAAASGTGRLRAHFRAADGSLRTLSVRQLPPHVCAYALTVHKSQGSEFDEVLLVLPPEPHPLATRELLYTGVTRARKQVTVHTGADALRQASTTRVQRASALAERLGWPVKPSNTGTVYLFD